jgi:hypothetical protein
MVYSVASGQKKESVGTNDGWMSAITPIVTIRSMRSWLGRDEIEYMVNMNNSARLG